MSLISAVLSGAKRVIKVLPDLVLGNGAEVAGKAIKTTVKNKGSIFTAAKNGVKAVEKLSIGANGAKVGFLTRMTSQVGRISSLTKAGVKAGAKKGFFGKILGGAKGLFKGLGKNMPLIGALMMIGCEIPNVVKASKEQGIGQGIKEIGKACGRLAGGGIGAAIGSAICPGIGTLVGWIAGEWLTGKVVGKSYSEKVAEEEMLAQEQAALLEEQQQYLIDSTYNQMQNAQLQPQQVPFQGQTYQPMQQSPVTNPFEQALNNNPMTNPYGGNNFAYGNDIFASNINFNALASNMLNNQYTQTQPFQQPQLTQQPQVCQINP